MKLSGAKRPELLVLLDGAGLEPKRPVLVFEVPLAVAVVEPNAPPLEGALNSPPLDALGARARVVVDPKGDGAGLELSRAAPEPKPPAPTILGLGFEMLLAEAGQVLGRVKRFVPVAAAEPLAGAGRLTLGEVFWKVLAVDVVELEVEVVLGVEVALVGAGDVANNEKGLLVLLAGFGVVLVVEVALVGAAEVANEKGLLVLPAGFGVELEVEAGGAAVALEEDEVGAVVCALLVVAGGAAAPAAVVVLLGGAAAAPKMPAAGTAAVGAKGAAAASCAKGNRNGAGGFPCVGAAG